MTRRTLLLAPLALAAQTPRPRLTLVWIEGPALPESFRRDSVVFPRAYAACPDRGAARLAVESGRFPHALADAGPRLADYFDLGGAITVMTASSADGDDSPFERSIHVPLAIRWPGRLAPREAPEILISHVDLLPTLLGMAGQTPPAELQGRDLSRLILARRGEIPAAVYAEGRLGYSDEWRALIRGFDKIVWNAREEVTGLYNLAEDPREETDLKDKREHALTRDSMMALARAWMRRLNDGFNPAGLRIRRPQ
jgi:hypothetical protein